LERLKVGSRGFYALLALTALTVAVAALAAVRIYDSGSSNLRPLPPGPPQAATGAASVEEVTFDEMLARADEIFVGTATAIGGSEDVTGDQVEGPVRMSVHRVRFDVDQSFRGTADGEIDVTLFDSEGLTYPFTVGEKYLIFGEYTEVGPVRAPALIPSGYVQGVYSVVSATLARNDFNGAVDLVELVEKAKRQP
jgi:hypothetical protein